MEPAPLGTLPTETDSAGKPSNELPNGAVTFVTDSPLDGGLIREYQPPAPVDPADRFYWGLLIVLSGLLLWGVKYWAEQSIVFLHDLLAPGGIDLSR